jgi:hypothetical protein
MPQYTDTNGRGNANTNTKLANGYSDQNSPNSSQMSSGDGGHQDSTTLISRTQKQHTTQQVTTTTKTIREIQYIGPDGQPLDYVPTTHVGGGPPPQPQPRLSTSSSTAGYDHQHQGYPPLEAASGEGYYNPNAGQPQPPQHGYANYAEYPHRPPTPPSPSDRSSSPLPQHREPDFMRQGGPGTAPGRGFQPRSGYDELDTTLMPPRPGEPYNRGSPEPSGSMSGSQGGPPALPFPIAPGSGGIQT